MKISQYSAPTVRNGPQKDRSPAVSMWRFEHCLTISDAVVMQSTDLPVGDVDRGTREHIVDIVAIAFVQRPDLGS